MPSLDFDTEKSHFLHYYNERASLFSDAVKSYKTLLSLLLADNDEFATPHVNGRVKHREECIGKFERKYRQKLEDDKKDYEIKEYITDILGLRIVCHYGSDVELVKKILQNNFQIIDETNKTKVMEAHDDTFGYKGLHLDLKLLENRAALPEYKRFSEYRFEVQIRTIIQDAWSSLDHKIKYKKNIPSKLKRRINRLAALFELADQEFETIRTETTKSEEEAILKHTEDNHLNAFLFLSTVKKHYQDYRFDGHKVDEFVEELCKANSSISCSDIELALTHEKLEQYIKYQSEHWNRFNPYTTIRHALYYYDKNLYKNLLFSMQRANFDKWIDDNSNSQATDNV